MASESDLVVIASEMAKLEGRFVNSQSSGMYLQTDDEATFKRLAVEAKCILDSELGHGNDFSMNLIESINMGSSGFFGGPSLAAVKGARQIVEGGVNHIRRRATSLPQKRPPTRTHYVDTTRMAELRAISNPNWDTMRLVRLCEELNTAHENECLMTSAMAVRSIVDHVPPLFGCQR